MFRIQRPLTSETDRTSDSDASSRTSSPTQSPRLLPTRSAGDSLVPRQSFEAQAQQMLIQAEAELRGNARFGEGDNLLKVHGPDGQVRPVDRHTAASWPLAPYGNGVLHFPGTGGLRGGMPKRTNDASEGSKAARPRTGATVPATGQLPPDPLGVARGELNQFLNALTPTQQQTLRQRFSRLQVHESDITGFSGSQRHSTAIVNAANSGLRGGGGVDGAVHQAAGEGLKAWEAAEQQKAAQGVEPCPPGQSRPSSGFDMPTVGHIIHAVGPTVVGGRPTDTDKATLRSAYQSAFNDARSLNIRDLGVSALSTGVYGYPPALAGAVMMEEALRELIDHGGMNLQLTSMTSGGADANFAVLSQLWNDTLGFLQALDPQQPVPNQPPVALMSRTATSSAGPSGTIAPRHPVTGSFRIAANHLSQPVYAYHPPSGDGYHHEVQQGHNCGLHVLQQQRMFYSGNDTATLVSQQPLAGFIGERTRAVLPNSDPEFLANEIGLRSTLQQFDDLAAYSQQDLQGAPSFEALINAHRLSNGNLVLPGTTAGGQRRPTLEQINNMPALGVTVAVPDPDDETRARAHSTQIIRLRDDADGNARFMEVDPNRHPGTVQGAPRMLPGPTMLHALSQLLAQAGIEQGFDDTQNVRYFDLLLPTADTLQRYQAMNRALPEFQPAPPPVPAPLRIALPKATPAAVVRHGLPTPPIYTDGMPRPGIQAPRNDWLLPFVSEPASEHTTNARQQLLQPPPNDMPLVRHYANVLWETLGVYAHPLHIRPNETQRCEDLATDARVNELLVTFRTAKNPQDASLLLRRNGATWDLVAPTGTRSFGALNTILTRALETADADGLRILRRPPTNAEWREVLPKHGKSTVKQGKTAFENLVNTLEGRGVPLFALAPTLPLLPRPPGSSRRGSGQAPPPARAPRASAPPADNELENVLMSMVGRGAIQNRISVGGQPIDIRATVRASRNARNNLREQLNTTLERLAAAPPSEAPTLRMAADQLTRRIASQNSPLLQTIFRHFHPQGNVPLDLNELTLMLPRRFTEHLIQYAEEHPSEDRITRKGKRSGSESHAADNAAERASRVRATFNALQESSPAPEGSRWDGVHRGVHTIGPRYGTNAAMLNEYWNDLLQDRGRRLDGPDSKGSDKAPSITTLRNSYKHGLTHVSEIENSVSPLSPNPLGHRDAARTIETLIPPASQRKPSYVNSQHSLMRWCSQHMPRFLSTPRRDGHAVLPDTNLDFMMPKMKRLPPELVPIAQGNLNRIVSELSEHFKPEYLQKVAYDYVQALEAIERMHLGADIIQQPRHLPDAALIGTLRAFGLEPTRDFTTDRVTLLDNLPNLQLNRDRFLALPTATQEALMQGAGPSAAGMRTALNIVEHLSLTGDVLHNFQPRIAEHAALAPAIEPAPKNIRGMIRQLLRALDRAWNVQSDITLPRLARTFADQPTQFAAAIEQLLPGFKMGKLAGSVHTWLCDQPKFRAEAVPLFQADEQRLQAYSAALPDTPDGQAARRTVLDWMRATETAYALDADDPVGDMLRMDADAMVAAARQLMPEPPLSTLQEAHLRGFHAWSIENAAEQRVALFQDRLAAALSNLEFELPQGGEGDDEEGRS